MTLAVLASALASVWLMEAGYRTVAGAAWSSRPGNRVRYTDRQLVAFRTCCVTDVAGARCQSNEYRPMRGAQCLYRKLLFLIGNANVRDGLHLRP
jgi:hypothetical protein